MKGTSLGRALDCTSKTRKDKEAKRELIKQPTQLKTKLG
jgi:hypothetical protein